MALKVVIARASVPRNAGLSLLAMTRRDDPVSSQIAPRQIGQNFGQTLILGGAPTAKSSLGQWNGIDRMSSTTVLVIRPGALGDTILTLPVLDTIQAKNPDAKITFLGNRSYRDLIPPHIRFEAFDDRTWLWLFNSEEAKPPCDTRPFDKAYVILNHPEDVVRNLKRAGTQTVHSCASLPARGRHVLEHLHTALGFPVPGRRQSLAWLAGEAQQQTIWVHPGSGGRDKCAPLAILTALVAELIKITGWKPVVTASEEDAFLHGSADWKHVVECPNVRLLQDRSLLELSRELAGSKLFLGNDSGIGHLAANLGISSTIFFANTDPVQWAPWVPSDKALIIDLRARKLEDYDISQDLRAIRKFLQID
jgi:heptosyltransferase III